MARRYNVFYDEHADRVAWKAHELWMAGEVARQEIAYARRIREELGACDG